MACSNCGFENPDGMTFCGACGGPLAQRCPQCGRENPPSFKFCGYCGTLLAGQAEALDTGQARPGTDGAALAEASEARSGVREAPEAERRQLSVMFCDLVGSTALSLEMDPEELREVVRAYQAVSTRVVDRYEGYVAQYLGDGLLVYFGYPAAHEDEADRAVRAGLDIIIEIEKLSRRLKRERGIELSARIGVHTGLVVVGEMGGGARREYLAMGDTPNIAARIQGVAQPGTLVVSDVTARLVARRFVCEDLGRPELKGVSEAVSVYQVVREREVESAFDLVAGDRAASPIGREQEVELLLDRWDRVEKGLGQVVFISGEAGIGKTYLMHAFRQNLRGRTHVRLECRCSPYHEHSAFYPIVDLLHRMLNAHPEETPEERLDMIAFMLERNGFTLPDTVPLFADLLSIPVGEGYPPLGLAPPAQKERTQAALAQLLVNLADEQPVALLVEDLHWADPSTLELLGLLVDGGRGARLLILLTFRPSFQPPWSGQAEGVHIALGRLPRPQVVRIVEQVTGGKALPGEVMEQIVARTDGVPLFVEELTKMVLESGLLRSGEEAYELTGLLPPLAIPATLHDSLMARLDRLATVKEVAQLGACLGREFPYDLLRAVAALDEDTLRHALDRLVEAELLYQHGVPPRSSYLFKHALIQDTAYQSLLKSTRQQFHQRIARQLEAGFPETVETQPELVAHHYAAAGLKEEAAVYWQRAGQRAAERSANVEAVAHLRKGLDLLASLPERPARDRQELEVQILLGTALITTHGYAAPEVGRAFARALALCRALKEERQLFRILFGQFATHFVRAEWQTARALAGQLLELADGAGDRALLLAAHVAMGTVLFSRGALDEARGHLTHSLDLYDVEQDRGMAVLYGQDLGVVAHAYLAHTLWVLGYPEQALAQSREALALAHAVQHPHSLALAMSFHISVHYFRQEAEAVAEQASALYELSKEEGFRHWLVDGMLFAGWASAMQGRREEAVRRLREGQAAYEASGIDLTLPYHQPMIAHCYGLAGQPDEGLAVLDETLAGLERRGERWFYEPEMHRLRGALLLAAGGAEAEACFLRAVALAEQSRARMLALRAAVSLGRLWQQQGRVDGVRALLETRYNALTEGFDTADLQAARALLDAVACEM